MGDAPALSRSRNIRPVAPRSDLLRPRRLDPRDPGTPRTLDALERLLAAVPPHRVVAADAQAWSEGAVRAGVLARALGLSDQDRRRAFHDAVLAAQAVREGAILVTRNVADFDRLQQLDARLRVLFYRT